MILLDGLYIKIRFGITPSVIRGMTQVLTEKRLILPTRLFPHVGFVFIPFFSDLQSYDRHLF